jgi:hypothetical protein
MGGRPSYNKEELQGFIEKFYSINGRYPEQRDFMHNKNYPSFRQYIREWGSWGNAFIKLGYRNTAKEKKALQHRKCLVCGKSFEFYLPNNKNRKSYTRKFCSIECRDKMPKDTYKKVLNNTTNNSYRRLAFAKYEWKCEICGYCDDIEYLYSNKSRHKRLPTILDVHHIDQDRSNNKLKNLTILCPTCHAKIHRGIITNVRRYGVFNILKWDVVSLEDYNNKVEEQLSKNKNRKG